MEMVAQATLTVKRARRFSGRLRIFPASEDFDTTEVLQVATRYVALPYLIAVSVATAVLWRDSRLSWLGPVTVVSGAAVIFAAEAIRVSLSKIGRTAPSWLILSVLLTLHLLVGINAWNSKGIEGGLWLSLVVLSSVGGILLPMRLSVANGLFGGVVLVGIAAVHSQFERNYIGTLILGSAVTALCSPTSSLFRDVIVLEARRRLRQQVSQLELFNLTLTAVIQSMTEGLVSCDGEGRVELWNRKLETLTGIPEFEAAGRFVWEVLQLEGAEGHILDDEHPCKKALGGPVFRGSVLGGSPGEMRLLSRDGRSTPVTIAAAPLIRRDKPAGLVALVVDVSRERELSQMRDSLVSMVSHELRTPLTMIVGFSELLLEGEFEERQYKECASEILDAANRLSGLVDELLSTAALERGTLDLNRRTVALSSLVEQSLASFLPEARDRVVKRIREAYVYVDPDRITQVLANLIGNALKYSDPGSPVEVRSRLQDGWVHLEVKDSGYGIDPDTLSKLFTMFTRSSDERVRQLPGTGLGLYIAKRLVALHGGEIEVMSRPGEGSTFTVILPIERSGTPGMNSEPVLSDESSELEVEL
ncbi:MAG: hypothetical protein C4318_03280 [Acidimicrobiia bacterium]